MFPPRKHFRLRLPRRALALGEYTLVMGILNVTPDSFSDGGLYLDTEAAVAQAIAMEAAGAHIIDIGGESTRPGSAGVSANEELRRILPVLENLRGKIHIPISVDTSKAEVAEAAADAGAEILNDVTGLRNDPRIADVAQRQKLGLILMHMRGTPRTMQQAPFARNVIRDVTTGLRDSIAEALNAGVSKRHWQKPRTKLRNYAAVARVSEIGISAHAGDVAEEFFRDGAESRRRPGSGLGNCGDGCSRHLAGRAYCARARRSGHGPGRTDGRCFTIAWATTLITIVP
jgi:hypothetical protein